jgi:hypothetical protein
MAPGGVEPPHADSKVVAQSATSGNCLQVATFHVAAKCSDLQRAETSLYARPYAHGVSGGSSSVTRLVTGDPSAEARELHMRKRPQSCSAPSAQEVFADALEAECSYVSVSGNPGGAAMPPLRTPAYGVGSAYEPPKMSLFPNVAGQACCGAGAVGTVVSFAIAAWAAARQASIAGQSAAFRTSFQTAAP